MRAIHSGCEWSDRRLLGCVLAQLAEQRGRALARSPAQDGVDESVTGATTGLCQLDAVGDDRTVGGAAQVEQLVQAEAQGRQQGRI